MEPERRRARLAEAIAWCSLQKLDPSPEESDEVKHRRRLLERSRSLTLERYSLESKRWPRWLTARRRSRLEEEGMRPLEKADPDSIEPLKDQMRTQSLRPQSEFLSRQTVGVHEDIVEDVCERRAELLQRESRRALIDGSGQTGGKILLYAPDENLCDGAAKYTSKGFFDAHNVPPWDCWVCFDGIYLVSWVPEALVAPANAGIFVNPEHCIKGAEDCAVERIFGASFKQSSTPDGDFL